MPEAGMVECDCGALVPEEGGPVHPYMRAAPACWRMYTELFANWSPRPDGVTSWSHVDCYAVQHPGGAETDRRQRRSVAVHLIALSLVEVFHVRPDALARLRHRTSETVLPRAGLADWPLLVAPRHRGSVRAADLVRAGPSRRAQLADEWRCEAWQAWRQHHDEVTGWAGLLLGRGGRP